MRRASMLAAAAVLMLAGCSKSEPTVNTQPVKAPAAVNSSTASAPSKAATSTPAPAKKAKVGDTLELTDRNAHLQVTLVKLVDPVKSTNEFMTPAAGKRYVAVQLRITNVGTKTFTDDPMAGTQAKDADGQVFEASYMPVDTEVGQPMDSGLTLAPGEKTLGVMTFEVPAGVKLVTVSYTNNSFVGHAVQWTLG